VIHVTNLDYNKQLANAADIFKALGHPTRVCIVNKLTKNNLNVTQMVDCLNTSQSNISQHLTILKNKGIIEGIRNGSEVIYSLIDDNVKNIIRIYFD
jgi:ArsR family transcriptional regulator